MLGKIFLVEFQMVPLNIERCRFYSQVKIYHTIISRDIDVISTHFSASGHDK